MKYWLLIWVLTGGDPHVFGQYYDKQECLDAGEEATGWQCDFGGQLTRELGCTCVPTPAERDQDGNIIKRNKQTMVPVPFPGPTHNH